MMLESWIALGLISALIVWVLLKIGDLINWCQNIWLSDREEKAEEREYLRDNIHQLAEEIANNNWPTADVVLKDALHESIRLHREASR